MGIDKKAITDNELVEACLKGSADAQRLLFERYSGRMMGLCLRYAGSREEAEDMLQEGFIRVFEKLDKFSGTGAFSGWMSTVIVNSALIMIRKKKREGYQEDIDEVSDLRNDEVDVLSQMSANELMAVVQQMPQGYRTVFNLFAIEGYAHKEIADMLDITESTSKTQFHKAKAFLRKELEKLNISSNRIA